MSGLQLHFAPAPFLVALKTDLSRVALRERTHLNRIDESGDHAATQRVLIYQPVFPRQLLQENLQLMSRERRQRPALNACGANDVFRCRDDLRGEGGVWRRRVGEEPFAEPRHWLAREVYCTKVGGQCEPGKSPAELDARLVRTRVGSSNTFRLPAYASKCFGGYVDMSKCFPSVPSR
jgi:hypothetical protein